MNLGLVHTLNFNQMLEKCFVKALEYEKAAKLYQANAPKDMSILRCIFYGKDNTTLIVSTSHDVDGKVILKDLDEPYMDDLVIQPPIQMTEAEAEKCLYDADHKQDWRTVVLRKPLGPEPMNTLYIFCYPNGTYWAVDTTNGSVFQLY